MEEKEVILKRKVWVKWNQAVREWLIIKAQGFYPLEEGWTSDELREFLKENDDVDIHLTY